MNDIHNKTRLPGPKARALIERDREVVSPSYVRDYPFVMSHGRGAEVWDVTAIASWILRPESPCARRGTAIRQS